MAVADAALRRGGGRGAARGGPAGPGSGASSSPTASAAKTPGTAASRSVAVAVGDLAHGGDAALIGARRGRGVGGGDGLGQPVDQGVGQAGRRGDRGRAPPRPGSGASPAAIRPAGPCRPGRGRAGSRGDGQDAQVELGRVAPVELELVAQRLLAPLQGGEVEEAVADRALELEGAVAGQQDDGGMGVDALRDRPRPPPSRKASTSAWSDAGIDTPMACPCGGAALGTALRANGRKAQHGRSQGLRRSGRQHAAGAPEQGLRRDRLRDPGQVRVPEPGRLRQGPGGAGDHHRTPRRRGCCGPAARSSRAPPAIPASAWRWSATRAATRP